MYRWQDRLYRKELKILRVNVKKQTCQNVLIVSMFI